MNSYHKRLELIRLHIDGTAGPEHMQELQEHLRNDPSFRRLFARYASLDAALGDGRLEAAPVVASVSPARQRSPSQWLSWRPVAAAAAGLVFGMCCTSAVFAYARPKPAAAATRPLPLADADFEAGSPIPASGIPARAGLWSGDFSRVVTAENGITPKQGLHMLRFLRSDNEHSPRNERSYVGEVAQVIDLRPLRAELAGGDRLVEVSAAFNSVAMPQGAPHEFAVKAAACRGNIADAPKLWEDRDSGGSRSHRSVVADSDKATWQRVTVPLVVPPDADFMIIECAVVFKGPQEGAAVAEFAGHYVDQVEVRVDSSPSVWTEVRPAD